MTSENLDKKVLPCADARKLTPCPGAECLWEEVQAQGRILIEREPLLHSIIDRYVLSVPHLGDGLARLLADHLGDADISRDIILSTFSDLYRLHPYILEAAARDLSAIMRDDPAARDHVTCLLFFKGFHALQGWRLAHQLWKDGRQPLALYIQSRLSQIYAIDIHPAAQMGSGIVLDHATGIVIGETAIIGDDVLMLHGVTLGTKDFEKGERHPIIGSQVIIGAGAKILGRTRVGDRSIVAAGSLVLEDIPADVTVAGVPARIIRQKD
jgi:serine O-acetyltransferase